MNFDIPYLYDNNSNNTVCVLKRRDLCVQYMILCARHCTQYIMLSLLQGSAHTGQWLSARTTKMPVLLPPNCTQPPLTIE